MEIKLIRSIDVNVYDLLADLYIDQKAPEYKKILETGLKEEINEKSIRKFFESSYPDKLLNNILGRVIEHFIEEDLIESNGKLTKKGRKIIDGGYLPKYEKGRYRFWCTKDELIGQRIIRYSRIEKDHTNVLYNFPLDELEGKYHRDLTRDHEFFLKKINTNRSGEILYQEKASFASKVNLTWLINKNSTNLDSEWNINGNLKRVTNIEYTKSYEENLSIKDIIESIFQDNYEYDSELEGVILEFKQVSKDSILSFQTNLHFQNIAVLNYGKFEELLIKDIPIIPKNLDSAKSWLLKIIELESKLRYLTQKDINLIIDNFKNRNEMKNFQDLSVSSSELLIYLKSNNLIEEYWHVQAPLDLEISLLER